MQKSLVVGILERSRLSEESIAQVLAVLARLSETGRNIACVVAVNHENWTLLRRLSEQSIPYFVVLTDYVERFRSELDSRDVTEFDIVLDNALHCFVVDSQAADDLSLEAGVIAVDQSDMLVMFGRDDCQPANSIEHQIGRYARAVEKRVLVIGAADFDKVEHSILSTLAYDKPEFSELAPEELVTKEKESLSAIANRYAPTARASMLNLILINLSVAFLAVTVSLLPIKSYLQQSSTAIKLLGLLSVLVLSRRQKRLQSTWVSARAGTEICRSYLGIWYLKRSPIIEPKFDFTDSDELLKSVRIAWYQDRDKSLEFNAAKQKYLSERLQHQRSYYANACDHASRWHPILRRSATMVTAIAFVTTFISAMLSWYGLEQKASYQFAKWLAAILPLLAAAILALVVARDLPRRSNRYGEMVQRLDRGKLRVAAAPSWPALWRAVADIEQRLSQEVSEWHSKNAMSK